MSHSNMLITFFFLIFFISFAFSSSFSVTHKCSPQQSLDLLLFKENMSSINHLYDENNDLDYECQDWLGFGYHPIMMNWNKNTDCCKWNGITCNHLTGYVIGIDLSCGMLQGTIHPNSTLFHLPHLQTLNLAYNDFTGSQFPSEIGRLSNSLTHLNLSQCMFTGEISVEILSIPKLVSLDLSGNYQLQFQPNVMKNLLRNSIHLTDLLLSSVDIVWVLPTYLSIPSSLKALVLTETRLQGKLPDNIFSLQNLEKLDLSNNPYLTGPWPEVNTSNNIPLKWLDLSDTKLSGEIPDSIGNLKYLNYLSLPSCRLVGSLPKSLANLRDLTTLNLAFNKLNGTLPTFLFTLPSIETIILDENMFSGGLPSEVFSCRSLKKLLLRSNQFDGNINQGSVQSFIKLANITDLDLSSNNFTGLWKLETLLSSLPNLQYLDISYSGLIVMNNNGTSHVNSKLQYLSLAACKLTEFPDSLRAMKNLTFLDLSDNDIHGRIPDWVEEIGGNGLTNLDLSSNFITGLPQVHWDGLEYLYLQSNQIRGPFPLSICSIKNLETLDMSNNKLDGVIPECLGNISSSLSTLDVNSNQIEGPFPSIICKMSYLRSLDMSNNSLDGVLPPCLGNISSSLENLIVNSNQIQGPLPSSICNLSLLKSLDLSNNNFDGVLPVCFENISSTLAMVDMGNNNFHGVIPNVYENCAYLKGLILNGNRLQGEVPTSLSKCQSLKVLDLGNNQLNGTFPGWLGDLPELQVLNLKSNKFHGPIKTYSTIKNEFSSMRVLILSHNEFVGLLPRTYFQKFIAMKNAVKDNTGPRYLNMDGEYYSVTIAVKGADLEFLQILVDYIIVDLSYNRFEGEIPGVIGSLISLIVLDLSHNNLTGEIPNGLGNLTEIESLDLSWNQLRGEIPQSLARLTFLGFLNLSQNHLRGRIPSGTQFSTFGTSFDGNPELCGLPLPKKCEHPLEPQLEVDGDEDEENGFTWRVVILGYGCGTVIGLVMGYVMLSTGRPKWFNEIADAGEHMIQTKGNKRRYLYIGK